MNSTKIALIGMFTMFAMLMSYLLFIGIPVKAATFTVIETPTLNNVNYAAIMAHDNDSLTMLIKNPGHLYTGQILHLEQRINILCLFE